MHPADGVARRPLIGISCSSSAVRRKPDEPLLDRLGQTYARAVSMAGGVPVLLPNLADECAPTVLVDRLDGLLLSGGYDVHPGHYGETPLNESVEVDGPRDDAEFPLVRQAVSAGLPIFAICRGIQALNVALGGSLWQDLPRQRPSGIRHRQSEPRHVATHVVHVETGSHLARTVGAAEVAVNSFHHQAVRDVAPGLRVVGRAEDGVIEAVEAVGPAGAAAAGPAGTAGAFLLGVQFHPEEMMEASEHARQLFRAFVDAARRTSRKSPRCS